MKFGYAVKISPIFIVYLTSGKQTMAGFNRKQIIKYSTVFGHSKPLDEHDLSVINKITWAKVLARLNYLARTKKDYNVAQVLSDWFGQGNHKYATEVFAKITENYGLLGIPTKDLGLINMWSNLYMLDQMLQIGSNSNVLNDQDSERSLFEIYLALNEAYANGSDQLNNDLKSPKYPEFRDWNSRALMTTLIKYHDFTHFNAAEILIANFIKAVYCFNFLEQNGHTELLKLFLKRYDVSCWQEFLDYLLPMVSSVTKSGDDSGLYYLNVPKNGEYEKRTKFLDQFALTDSVVYAENVDFLHARSNPLFKTEDNKYLIMDSLLVVNRIYNSMFFELKTLAEANKSLHPRYGAFFSLYTFDYIEKFLCYNLLDYIFDKSSCYNISGDEIHKKFNFESEPDYYVRNGNKVFLFEIKGSMLTGAGKQSFSFTNLEKEIKKKYYVDDSNGQHKAVLQLVDRIRTLFKGGAKFDSKLNPRTIRIFPILLVSEIAMTTPGMNYILNEWFLKELKNDEYLKDYIPRINNLVILDIDTLILNSEAFQKNNRLIEKSILEYINYVADKPVKPVRSVPYDKAFIEERAMRGFDSYVDFLKRNYKAKSPSLFMQFGTELIAHRLIRKENIS